MTLAIHVDVMESPKSIVERIKNNEYVIITVENREQGMHSSLHRKKIQKLQ